MDMGVGTLTESSLSTLPDTMSEELARRAAAWRAERAKLVDGHTALARRLAAEVDARQALHAKLIAAESKQALVDAAERAAADATSQSDAHQSRIDTLLATLETRDGEVREPSPPVRTS